MDFINVKGIVTKEVNTGETDKYIDLFTDKLGKITIYVKGAKSKKSCLNSTQILNYCDYVLYKRMDKYYISSCELIESFYQIRCDVTYLTYATHFLDIINSVICENQSQIALLRLLLNTLYILSKGKKDPKFINVVFELRLLKILGYQPYIKDCIRCNKDFEVMYFDFLQSGLICENCKIGDAFKLQNGTKKALNFIMSVSNENIFKFKLSESCLDELDRFTRIYLKEKLEREYNKLDFLSYIN